MRFKRQYHTMLELPSEESMILVCAGLHKKKYLKSSEIYRIEDDKWTWIADLKIGRQKHTTFAFRDSDMMSLYTIGGVYDVEYRVSHVERMLIQDHDFRGVWEIIKLRSDLLNAHPIGI